MRRVTCGFTSCVCFAAALMALGWMGYCRLMIATTPPGGSGEFRGMGHLGWRFGILVMTGAVPLLGLVGLGLGLAGTSRGGPGRRTAVVGFTLNGLVLLGSPAVFLWARSVLGSTV